MTSIVRGARPARMPEAGAQADPPATPAARDDLKRALDRQSVETERAEERLMLQHQRFDLQTERRAEIVREEGVLRDMMMAQLKDEDGELKKWIALI